MPVSWSPWHNHGQKQVPAGAVLKARRKASSNIAAPEEWSLMTGVGPWRKALVCSSCSFLLWATPVRRLAADAHIASNDMASDVLGPFPASAAGVSPVALQNAR